MKKIHLNDYTIQFNPFWGFWSAYHPIVGPEYFRSRSDAYNYAKRG